jgi:hypothetical protein
VAEGLTTLLMKHRQLTVEQSHKLAQRPRIMGAVYRMYVTMALRSTGWPDERSGSLHTLNSLHEKRDMLGTAMNSFSDTGLLLSVDRKRLSFNAISTLAIAVLGSGRSFSSVFVERPS